MNITLEHLRKSVAAEPFGSFQPFVPGDEQLVAAFYRSVLASIERSRAIALMVEDDHHGSGYASYISAFLYPRDGRSRVQHSEYVETTGVLLYLSRLAPIAVFGRSFRTQNTKNSGKSSGFVDSSNVGLLPEGDWSDFYRSMTQPLDAARVELLPRESLLEPAPTELQIPTAFDPPYFVLDALFYWSD